MAAGRQLCLLLLLDLYYKSLGYCTCHHEEAYKCYGALNNDSILKPFCNRFDRAVFWTEKDAVCNLCDEIDGLYASVNITVLSYYQCSCLERCCDRIFAPLCKDFCLQPLETEFSNVENSTENLLDLVMEAEKPITFIGTALSDYELFKLAENNNNNTMRILIAFCCTLAFAMIPAIGLIICLRYNSIKKKHQRKSLINNEMSAINHSESLQV